MKVDKWSNKKIADTRELWLVCGPSGKGGIFRQVGECYREVGNKVNEIIPLLRNALASGDIGSWIRNKTTEPTTLPFLRPDRVIRCKGVDLNTLGLNGFNLNLVLQDPDDPEKTLYSELHEDFVEENIRLKNQIANCRQFEEQLLTELEDANTFDKMKLRELNEKLRERLTTVWGRNASQE